MRQQHPFLTLILVFGIGAVMAVHAVPVADQNKIAELINQLGSQNFRQRDAATKELDAIGEAALEALRKAAKNSDMEVSNRATALVAKIEARCENARLLAPTYVELSLKEASVDYAVAELAKKSGYAIVIGGDKSKLADRKVTLETGKVPFWKAVEMLCEKAELNESEVTTSNTGRAVPTPLPRVQVMPIKQPQQVQPPMKEQAPNPKPPQGFAVDPPVVDEAPAKKQAQPQPVPQPPAPVIQGKVMATTVVRPMPANAPAIVLVDGKANTAPAFVDGAIRVRSLNNANLQAKHGQAPENEIGLFLEVKPEPKIQVQQVLGVKIDKAVDNYDQALDQSMVADNSNPQVGAQPIGGPRANMIKATGIPGLGNAFAQTIVPIRLKKGEKDAKSIKELRGTVSLKMRTPVEDIITVDNVLKAKGESIKGKAESTLRIIDAATEKNGDIKLEVELQMSHEIQPPNGNGNQGMILMNGGNGAIRIQGNIQIAPAAPNAPPALAPPQEAAANYLGLELIDDKGVSLKLVDMQQTRMQFQQNGRTIVATIIYRPEKDQEAAKLVLKGTRLATVDVPFVLKDIPVK